MTPEFQILQCALDAVKANHEWHQEYDDYGGYRGSELADMNESVI